LAKASHEPFNSLGIHLYLKNAFLCNTSETSYAHVYKNKSLDKYSLFNNPYCTFQTSIIKIIKLIKPNSVNTRQLNFKNIKSVAQSLSHSVLSTWYNYLLYTPISINFQSLRHCLLLAVLKYHLTFHFFTTLANCLPKHCSVSCDTCECC
jgi:hypothetical protein